MNRTQKTEPEQIDFFERCYERFLMAKNLQESSVISIR